MSAISVVLQDLGLQGGLRYNQGANMLTTSGYTSMAGNTYFLGFRLSDQLIIKESIGQGYARTFLNGIKIYARNTQQLLAEADFHCCFYSPSVVAEEASRLLMGAFMDAARRNGVQLDAAQLKSAIAGEINSAISGNCLEREVIRLLR